MKCSGIPIAVGIYILSAHDKSQKESLSAIEKTLSAQDKNQKESLSAQDKRIFVCSKRYYNENKLYSHTIIKIK